MMNFKDYLKDRLIFILLYFLSTALIVIIMMLDILIRKDELNLYNIAYAFLMSIMILTVIILLDYNRKNKFYNAIDYQIKSIDDLNYMFNIPDNINTEYDFLKKLLVKDYNVYVNTLEKYRKSFKTQTDFNNRWVHQMKTPISVIRLLLENEKTKTIDENTRKSYESIEEEIEKLSHGLEMALYTLRANDFELDFIVEDVSLFETVRSVINENKNAFIVNSIYPKMMIQENIMVKSDRKWLKFIVNQIISNSIKYSKVKEIENKTVSIVSNKDDKSIILSIQDMGVGIPKEDIDRVFDPFFTGKNGRKYFESTGMGLYLSKYICEKIGHGLYIDSIAGEGTRVNIIFYNGKSIYNLE